MRDRPPPLTHAQKQAVRFLAEGAASDPRFHKALGEAVEKALANEDVEARVWLDHVGEFALARDVLRSVFKEPDNAFLLREIRPDDDTLTLSFELVNGSAIVLGLKCYRFRMAGGDMLRELAAALRAASPPTAGEE